MKFVLNNEVGQPNLNGTVFSEVASELTCNMSASRKRNRDDFIPQPQKLIHLPHHLPQHYGIVEEKSGFLENQLNCLGETSSSDRSPFLVSSHSQDLKSNLLLPDLEIDALIQLQNEKLRTGLEEMTKRHCASLMSVLEHQFLKKLEEEKEAEITNANRRNAELEEKIKQMSSENQIWFNVAKNNEAMVFSLKTSLEQIILQNQNENQIKEGFGDSDDQSCCNIDDNNGVYIAQETLRENREIEERRRCKVCHENEISVLALPCRHLCLCKQCQSNIESCPICNASINGSLQIFMS